MSSSNGAAHQSPRNRLASLPNNGQELSESSSLEARKGRAVAALHQHFDKLNALWAEKENELVAMHVPRCVWHDYKSESDHCGPDRVYYIGLAKWRGQWRLLHSINYVQPDESDDCPIVEASLELRLEAAEHFEKLRELVIEAAEESVAKVQDAIKALSRP